MMILELSFKSLNQQWKTDNLKECLHTMTHMSITKILMDDLKNSDSLTIFN